MTIGATVQRVLRREPLSEEPQDPMQMPPWNPAFQPENNGMNVRVDLSGCCARYRTKRRTK